MVFPVIFFPSLVVSVGDLEFLKQKEDDGSLIIQNGSSSTTGELVSYTPANGKTFYFYYARQKQETEGDSVLTDIENDGTLVTGLLTRWRRETTDGFVEFKILDEFVGVPDSLVGDGAKKFRLNITANSNKTVEGTLVGWIEDT